MACSTLYSYQEKGVTARNLKIDDIEPLINNEILESAKSNVGVQASDPFSNNNYYPLLYEMENKRVINGLELSNGLNLSDTTSPSKLFGRTDVTSLEGSQTTNSNATDGYLKAKNSIKPYNSFYSIDLSISDNYKEFGTEYSSMLKPSYDWMTCLLSSRYVSNSYNSTSFGVFNLGSDGVIRGEALFSSDHTEDNTGSGRLFPIVTVPTDLIETTVKYGAVYTYKVNLQN